MNKRGNHMKAKKLHLYLAIFLGILLCMPTQKSYSATIGSTSLSDTLNFAFNYSPNIKAAQEARQRAEHEVRAAESGYYPSIGIWAGAGVEQQDNAITRETGRDQHAVGAFSTGLVLSQSIWEGGKTSATVRMNEEMKNFSSWQLMDSANSLAYSAISAHADVLRRRSLVTLAKENVEENAKILRNLRTRFNQGLSNQGDVKLVEGRLARANASLIAHTQGLHTAMATYTRITGQPTPKNLQAVNLPKTMITDLDAARNASINKNLRIQADLAAIRSAMADVDTTRSEFAPKLSIDAGPTFTTNGYDGDQRQFTWTAMLNMQWDLYSGGRDVATVKAKSARVRELRQILHQTMDEVNEELISVYAVTKSSKEQAKFYATAAKAAKSAKINYDTQFAVGRRDLLSVLDAEGEYYFSAVEREIRDTDAIIGEYRMLALTGELLEEVNISRGSLEINTTQMAPSVPMWKFKPETLNQQEALEGSTLTQPR